MSKILAIFDKNVAPVGFITDESGMPQLEAIEDSIDQLVSPLLKEIIEDAQGSVMAREEIVEENGDIVSAGKVVAPKETGYLQALAELITSATGFLTTVIYSEAKKILIDLGKSVLPQSQKDKIFADIINMSEEDAADLARSYREVFPLKEELEKLESEWGGIVAKVKGNK